MKADVYYRETESEVTSIAYYNGTNLMVQVYEGHFKDSAQFHTFVSELDAKLAGIDETCGRRHAASR